MAQDTAVVTEWNRETTYKGYGLEINLPQLFVESMIPQMTFMVQAAGTDMSDAAKVEAAIARQLGEMFKSMIALRRSNMGERVEALGKVLADSGAYAEQLASVKGAMQDVGARWFGDEDKVLNILNLKGELSCVIGLPMEAAKAPADATLFITQLPQYGADNKPLNGSDGKPLTTPAWQMVFTAADVKVRLDGFGAFVNQFAKENGLGEEDYELTLKDNAVGLKARTGGAVKAASSGEGEGTQVRYHSFNVKYNGLASGKGDSDTCLKWLAEKGAFGNDKALILAQGKKSGEESLVNGVKVIGQGAASPMNRKANQEKYGYKVFSIDPKTLSEIEYATSAK